MSDIAVIFEGCGRRTEKSFPTIAETVEHLVGNGYTRVSGAPHYAPSVATRLYKDTGSGRYARINTTSTPLTWPVIVEQVAEAAQAAVESAFWREHYELNESARDAQEVSR